MRTPVLAGLSFIVISGPVFAAASLAHNCQCLAKGRTYAQGEIACIDGRRLQCGMSQNVSSWNPVGGQCRPEDLNASLMPSFVGRGLPRAEKKPIDTTLAPSLTPM